MNESENSNNEKKHFIQRSALKIILLRELIVKNNRYLSAVILIIGIAMSSLSHASDSAEEILPVTKDGISYVTGGIGDAQQNEMENIRINYNLRLTFAIKKSGEYLANVDISIKDAKGKNVIEVKSGGPLFFVNLPAGKYQVTAVSNSKKLTQKTSIVKKNKRNLNFYWDAE